MIETKCFRDAFRDQLHELFGPPNMSYDSVLKVEVNDEMLYYFEIKMNIISATKDSISSSIQYAFWLYHEKRYRDSRYLKCKFSLWQ